MIQNISKQKISIFCMFSLLFLIAFSSCKKEEIDTETIEYIAESELMNISISGFTKDEANVPIEGVFVKINDNTTQSDENGFYTFNNIDVYGPKMRVEFMLSDYHKNFKTLEVYNGGRFHQGAVMVLLGEPFNFSSSEGGEAKMDNFRIIFQENSFIDENGNAYNGAVSAFVHYFDPTDDNFSLTFPSDYDVLNLANEKNIMQVFSGVSVELKGSSGEFLQINMDASLRLRIPDELLTVAPNTVELGYYNVNREIWEEQNSATIDGKFYETSVSHFSYWCCYLTQDPTVINGYVFEEITDSLYGIPMEDLYIEVNILGTSIAGSTRTSNNGSFILKVPKNLDLEMNIYANSFNEACGEPIYTESIPALQTFYNTGTILPDAAEMIIISGIAKDCSQNNLDGGFVFLENNSNDILVTSINSDGTFTMPMYNCDDVFSLIIYDKTFTFSSEKLVNLNSEMDLILNDVLACEVLSIPPYFMKITTGSDTIICSSSEGTLSSSVDTEGNINKLQLVYCKADIQNTSQDLNVGVSSVYIYLSGLEDQACEISQVEILIPLKDVNSEKYLLRSIPGNPISPDTWAVSYNCIDNAEYLHVNGKGLLEDWGNIFQIVTHRDPEVFFDIYYPL